MFLPLIPMLALFAALSCFKAEAIDITELLRSCTAQRSKNRTMTALANIDLSRETALKNRLVAAGYPLKDILETQVLVEAGSSRRYLRLRYGGENPHTMILSAFDLGKDSENLRFAQNAKFLGAPWPSSITHQKDFTIAAPRIAVDTVKGRDGVHFSLMSDLGPNNLKEFSKNASPEELEEAYKKTLDMFSALHSVNSDNLSEFSIQPKLGSSFLETQTVFGQAHDDMYSWEHSYFREQFLGKHLGRNSEELFPKEASDQLLNSLRKAQEQHHSLIHRDANGENIPLVEKNGELQPAMIDFQGMRWGLAEYDLASLIYDPYTNLDPPLRNKLIDYAFEKYKRLGLIDPQSSKSDWLKTRFYPAAMSRLMQAMGAYGKLMGDGKAQYEKYIAPASRALLSVLKSPEMNGAHFERLAAALAEIK